MDVVRIGMVGARFGAALHLMNLAPLRGGQVEIVGVCSVSRESAEACARRFEIPFVTTEFAALLARPDVDAVDLCIPPALHHTFAVAAAEAGKHIIVEKPLTGYFGEPGDPEPIGEKVSKTKMLAGARKNAHAVRDAVRRHKVKLCYAENWVYSPPVAKLRRLIRAAGGGILDVRAEENHSGSHSTFARQWKHSGGGALLRMGVHWWCAPASEGLRGRGPGRPAHPARLGRGGCGALDAHGDGAPRPHEMDRGRSRGRGELGQRGDRL